MALSKARPRVSVLQAINKRFAKITCANGSRTGKQAWHLHRCAMAPMEEVPQETMSNSADFPPKRKAGGLMVHDPASASGS